MHAPPAGHTAASKSGPAYRLHGHQRRSPPSWHIPAWNSTRGATAATQPVSCFAGKSHPSAPPQGWKTNQAAARKKRRKRSENKSTAAEEAITHHSDHSKNPKDLKADLGHHSAASDLKADLAARDLKADLAHALLVVPSVGTLSPATCLLAKSPSGGSRLEPRSRFSLACLWKAVSSGGQQGVAVSAWW